MTLSTSTARVAYATNGTTGPFAVNFYFLANSHLAVVYKVKDLHLACYLVGQDVQESL
jgi:hypothetical protein